MGTKSSIIALAIAFTMQNAVGQSTGRINEKLHGAHVSAIADDYSSSEMTYRVDRSRSRSFRGSHVIHVNIGLLSDYGVEGTIATGRISSTTGIDGIIGSVNYDYWVQEELAVGVGIGVVGSEMNTSVNGLRVSLETSSVVPVLFGITYQPTVMNLGENVKAHIFASAGPCIRSVTRSFTGTGMKNETFTETVFGAHLGVGTDFLPGGPFVVGLRGGYYLSTDYDSPGETGSNLNSPEFSLSIGVLLGTE